MTSSSTCSAALATLCFSSALAAAPGGGIVWRADYVAALAEARAQDRLLLVFFRRDDRPLCRTMERETFAQPDVVRACREDFIPVHVNIEASPDLFANMTGGTAGLATCAVDGNGDVLSTLAGFADADVTLRFLDAVKSGRARLTAARAAAQKAPEDAAALYELGEAYLGVDNPLRAEEQFRRVIDAAESTGSKVHSPLSGTVNGSGERLVAFSHERIARIRALRGRNREAREHAAAYRRLDPDNRFGRLDRVRLTEARALAIEMKYADAVPILEDLLTISTAGGETDEILLLLGTVLHENGDAARALPVLERIPREFPRSAWLAPANERIAHIRNPPPGHVH